MPATDARWDLIAAERRGLADLLDTLGDEQWATLTLCDAWTVKDMAAHVMVGPTVSYPELAGAMVMARFNLDRALERMTAPLYRPIRKIMPDFGGIDFSPLVLLLLIKALQIVIQHTLVQVAY